MPSKKKKPARKRKKKIKVVSGIEVYSPFTKIAKTSSLEPHPMNPNTHPPEQITRLAAIIKAQGWRNLIVVSALSGKIIKGHARFESAQKLELKTVPIEVQQYPNEESELADLIADNRIAELAEMDMGKVQEVIEQMDEKKFDIELTAYSIEELEKLAGNGSGGSEPPIPPPPKKPKSKRGEIYQLGQHRLMCGDATNHEDIKKLMDGRKADMVFTDPPYGMFLDADYSQLKTSLKMLKEKGIKGGNKYDNIRGDATDFDPRFIITIFEEFAYCSEIFLWGADYYSELLQNKNEGSWIVWDKRNETLDNVYGSCFELCWSKKKHKRKLARIKWAGVFGTEHEPGVDGAKRFHPTQKPMLLVNWFFDEWGNNKNIVVDLFGGSGSTLLACEQTGRKCFMMEIEAHYIDVIIKRWENFTGKKAKKL